MDGRGRGVSRDCLAVHMWASLWGRSDEDASDLLDRLNKRIGGGLLPTARRVGWGVA